MAGFASIAMIGEHFTNKIVNVFHYRSTAWLPGQGNPFDDSLAFLDAFLSHVQTAYLDLHEQNYTLLRAEAVGYDDTYGIVTSSPIIRTIGLPGNGGVRETSGSFVSANLGLRCGEQVNINGIGKSKRNRGYLSIGPVPEDYVDNYGHVGYLYANALNVFGALVDDGITVLSPAVTLTPIRIHEKWLQVGPLRQLILRTYSDVMGYTVPRKASVRRSRMGEA